MKLTNTTFRKRSIEVKEQPIEVPLKSEQYMQTTYEKTIDSILRQQDPQSILGFIQKKVTELKEIDRIWRSAITADLGEHSRIANFRDGCLVVEVNNAGWATRLRYLVPDLIKKLLKYPILGSLKNIEWYIQPTNHLPLILSDTSAQPLNNTAMDIKIKSLRKALVKI
jgi:hypothetical protein